MVTLPNGQDRGEGTGGAAATQSQAQPRPSRERLNQFKQILGPLQRTALFDGDQKATAEAIRRKVNEVLDVLLKYVT